MSTDSEIEFLLDEINALEGTELEKVPWLVEKLDHPDSSVRWAAVFSLDNHFTVPQLTDKFLQMLDSDPDEDVVALIISAVSERHRGTRAIALLHRIQRAMRRFEPNRSGTRETYDDAKLCVMKGYDSKGRLRLTTERRQRELAEIDSRIAGCKS